MNYYLCCWQFDGTSPERPKSRVKSAPSRPAASSDDEIDMSNPQNIVREALRKASGGITNKEKKSKKLSKVEEKLYARYLFSFYFVTFKIQI